MIAQWETLRCDCKSDLFTPIVRLKYKSDGGGTTTEPAGHKCAACGAVVDNAYMIRLIEIDKKRKEAARLTAEIAADEAAAPKKKPVEAAAAGRS